MKSKAQDRVLQIDLQDRLNKGSTTEMFFSDASGEEEIFHQKDLIQLEPFGLSLVPDANHPFLLLKSQDQKHTLPVLLNSLEAGVTLTQSNKSIAPVTPHKFAQELMKSLDIQIVQCVFVQIKGTHQYVRLYLKGHPAVNSFKLRADEVMSLVLHFGVPLFATRSYIEKSKILTAQIEGLTQNLSQTKRILHKNQSYVI